MDFETATKILLDYKESDIRSTDDEIKERFTGNQTRLRAFFNECYVNYDIDRLRRFKNLIIDIQEELNSGNDLKKMGLSEDNEPFFQLPLRIRKITDYSQKIGTSYLNELLKEINSIIKLSEKEQPRKTESDKQEQSESKNKKGRKKVEVKNAKDYLTFDDTNKAKFIDLLKEEYSNCEPKTMNHLILVLLEKTYLKKVTNKELKESFCEILNVEQSQANFDRYMNRTSIDESLKKSIEKTVSNLIIDNSIV